MRAKTLSSALVAACLALPTAAALAVDADLQVPVGIGASVGANVAGNVHGHVGLLSAGLSNSACDWVVALNSLFAAYATSDNLALASSGDAGGATLSALALEPTSGSASDPGSGSGVDATLSTTVPTIDANITIGGGISESYCSQNFTGLRINATTAGGFGLPPPTGGDPVSIAAALDELAASTVAIDGQIPIGVDAAVSANVIGNVVLDVNALVVGSSTASCNAIIAANTQMLAVTTSSNEASALGGAGSLSGLSLLADLPIDPNVTLPDVNGTLPDVNATLPNGSLALPTLPSLSLLGLLGLPNVDIDLTLGSDSRSVCETRVQDVVIHAGVAPVTLSSSTTTLK